MGIIKEEEKGPAGRGKGDKKAWYPDKYEQRTMIHTVYDSIIRKSIALHVN